MKTKRLFIGIFTLVLMFTLAACSGKSTTEKSSEKDSSMDHGSMQMDDKNSSSDDKNMDMGEMDHSGSGEVPAGLKVAENPKYKVGSQAIMKADHMEGMNGAEATIVGAYDTTVYAVTYTPATGGDPVKNHKWVIQEEIKDAGDKILEPGTKVTIQADHMEGMNGATGTIDSAEKTTVYMVDYTPTTGGEKVTNHKWVTENELSTK